MIHTGKVAAHKRLHAKILLKANISELGDKWLDRPISEVFGVSTRTVERVRERLVQEGLESALNRAKSIHVKSRTIDSENEVRLIALWRAPEGRHRWTLRLLGQQRVELGYAESVSHETIRQSQALLLGTTRNMNVMARVMFLCFLIPCRENVMLK